jgi:hypothetical protein
LLGCPKEKRTQGESKKTPQKERRQQKQAKAPKTKHYLAPFRSFFCPLRVFFDKKDKKLPRNFFAFFRSFSC